MSKRQLEKMVENVLNQCFNLKRKNNNLNRPYLDPYSPLDPQIRHEKFVQYVEKEETYVSDDLIWKFVTENEIKRIEDDSHSVPYRMISFKVVYRDDTELYGHFEFPLESKCELTADYNLILHVYNYWNKYDKHPEVEGLARKILKNYDYSSEVERIQYMGYKEGDNVYELRFNNNRFIKII